MPSSDPLAGFGATIRLDGDNILVESRVALFGDVTTRAAKYTGGNRAVLLQRLHDAFDRAARFSPNRFRAEGNDYNRQDMAALKEFLRSDKPLVLRVDRAVDIIRCIELAETHGLQLIVLGGAEAWKVRERLVAAGVTVILNATNNLPTGFDALGARLENAALLREAGVNVVYAGSESHNARNLRQLAGNAVAHGVPWYDALNSLTRVAALTWNLTDTGLLRPGAVADVVVWSGDPLELTTWAVYTSIDGQLIANRSRHTELFRRYMNLSLSSRFR